MCVYYDVVGSCLSLSGVVGQSVAVRSLDGACPQDHDARQSIARERGMPEELRYLVS